MSDRKGALDRGAATAGRDLMTVYRKATARERTAIEKMAALSLVAAVTKYGHNLQAKKPFY